MNIIETIQAMWKNTVMLKNLIIISVLKIHIKNDLTIQFELKSKRDLGMLVLHRITGCWVLILTTSVATDRKAGQLSLYKYWQIEMQSDLLHLYTILLVVDNV